MSLGKAFPLLGATTLGGGGPASDAVSQGIQVTDFALVAEGVQLTQSMTVGETAAALIGKILAEHFGVSEICALNGIYGTTAADTASIRDTPLLAIPVALLDEMTAGDALSVIVALLTLERVGVGEAHLVNAIAGLSYTDTIQVTDSLLRFFGADVEEAINITPALASLWRANASLSEQVDVASELTPLLMLRVTATDTIEIDPVEALTMLFGGDALVDGIQIEGAYLSPGDGFTTWVMNARSGAVTEYDDFAFNSFAMLGNSYMGASDQGLFELLGDDSDGRDIIPRIKSGYFKFGGMKLSSMRSAYIGLRGGGDFVLRIITGDGKTYDYAAKPQDMRTTRVRMGKGLRAHYFAFELIGDGADFDLDAIEFVPIVNQRRV